MIWVEIFGEGGELQQSDYIDDIDNIDNIDNIDEANQISLDLYML